MSLSALAFVALVVGVLAVSQACRDGPPVCPSGGCDTQPTEVCDYCPGCGSKLAESPYPSRLAYNCARIRGWWDDHREWIPDSTIGAGEKTAREAFLAGEIDEEELESRLDEELGDNDREERVVKQ